MAKASTGQAAPAKVKAAAPAVAARKKGKPGAAVSAKKAAKTAQGKKPPAKMAAAPKTASAPNKVAPAKKVTAKAPTPPKTAVKGKTATAKTASAKRSAPPRKTPAPKVIAVKAAARAKTVAKTGVVKASAPRRPTARSAVPTPAARRGRPVAAPRKTPVRKLYGAPQVFTVSHLNEADFKTDGLRAYAQYRDLGIAAATGGLCQAHVIRLVPPCTEEVRKRHLHQADLQLVYVLKGWMKNEFEGQGEQMMSTGSCWLQPTGIKHTVLDYSPDCEVLEIIVPADFKTEELT